MQKTYHPVIIIGAPRSGTNMLRDLLVKLPGVGTWPCDEINYIWRHGNKQFESDEFLPTMAAPSVVSYIQRKFDRIAYATDADVVIEKTCANSLRVGFVDEVIPNAKYIYIVRDGLDVAASALKRWHAGIELGYVIKKARYVPPSDIPSYAMKFLINHVTRLASKDKRLAVWGPVLNDMVELLENYTLPQVCALQWKKCVDNAERDFTFVDDDRICRISYESFVLSPVGEFEKIANFIGKRVSEPVYDYLKQHVQSGSVGSGRREFGDEMASELRQLMADSLERYGYA